MLSIAGSTNPMHSQVNSMWTAVQTLILCAGWQRGLWQIFSRPRKDLTNSLKAYIPLLHFKCTFWMNSEHIDVRTSYTYVCLSSNTYPRKILAPFTVIEWRAQKNYNNLTQQRGIHIIDLDTQVANRNIGLPHTLPIEKWSILRWMRPTIHWWNMI